MRTSPQMKLDAIQHAPTRKILAAILSQMREFSGALSKSVESGQTPAAIPVPTNPLEPPTDGTLPTPTTGTLLRGTAANTWENLAIGAAGSVLTVSGGNANWQPVTLTNELLDGSNHTDTLAGTEVRGDLIVRNASSQWARFGIGGSGTVLTSDGTDPAWTAPVAQTSELLSSTHTDTLADNVEAGDVIIGNSTPKWARLAKGTSKQVLAMNNAGTLPEWAGLDNSYIVDRTRYFFVPAMCFYEVGVGVFNMIPVGSYPNAYLAMPMAGNFTTQLCASWVVPADWSGTITWDLVWALSTTDANPVRMELTVKTLSDGNIGTNAVDFTGTQDLTPPGVADQINFDTLSSANTGVAAGSVLRIGIQRLGMHANDTNPDIVYMLGLRAAYTADM